MPTFDKINIITHIKQRLSEIEAYIGNNNSTGTFDINQYAENIVRNILNILYGYQLENLNFTERANFPVIDLGDSKAGICFQVTSNKSTEDFKNLENRFLNKKLNEKYPSLYLFILSGTLDKSNTIKAFKHTNLSKDRILNFSSVIDFLENLHPQDHYKIIEIRDLLDNHHDFNYYVEKALKDYLHTIKKTIGESSMTFVEPSFIEETINSIKQESDWEENHLMKIYSKREYSKLSLDTIIIENTQLIITGDPGSGKSETLRYTYSKYVKQALEGLIKNNTIPVLISANGSLAATKIEDLIRKEINKHLPSTYAISAETIADKITRFLLSNNTICLFIDGYDELALNHLKEWNDHVRLFLNHNPSSRLIVAVRKNRLHTDINLPINKVFDILPFDDVQTEEFINKMIVQSNRPSSAPNARDILNTLRESEAYYFLPALIRKMLIGTLINSDTLPELNQKKAQIYLQYFQQLLIKRLEEVGIINPNERLDELYSELLNEYFKVLSEVAFVAVKPNTLIPENLFAQFNQLLVKIEAKINHRHLFSKGILFFKNELQILREFDATTNNIIFTHYTYQEFFFAFWLNTKLTQKNSQVINWIQSAYYLSKYQQVFLFLVGLMSQSQAEDFLKSFQKWPFKVRIYPAKKLDLFTNSKLLFIGELLSEGNFTAQTTTRFSDELFAKLVSGNDISFRKICKILSRIKPGSKDTLDRLLEYFIKNYTYHKKQGIIDYAVSAIRLDQSIIEKIKSYLYHKDSYIRGAAIAILAVSEVFDEEILARITELNFEKDSYNGSDALDYINALSKTKPEKCLDFAVKWENSIDETDSNPQVKKVHKIFIRYYCALFLQLPGYDVREIEGNIIRILKDPNSTPEELHLILQASRKTGVRREKVISEVLTLMESNPGARADALMYFRDAFVVKQVVIEKAVLYLEDPNHYTIVRAVNYLETIQFDGNVKTDKGSIHPSEKIVKLLNDTSEDERAVTYAIDYLGKVKYKTPEVVELLLQKLINPNTGLFTGERDHLVRYFMNIRHYSPVFFNFMLSLQTIKDHLDMHSFDSDTYFEKIELYIPEEHLKSARIALLAFFAQNSLNLFKIRKHLKDADSVSMINTQLERYLRTSLALQKIVMYYDERQAIQKLTL